MRGNGGLGFVGLGKIGNGMVTNLLKAGRPRGTRILAPGVSGIGPEIQMVGQLPKNLKVHGPIFQIMEAPGGSFTLQPVGCGVPFFNLFLGKGSLFPLNSTNNKKDTLFAPWASELLVRIWHKNGLGFGFVVFWCP